MASFKLTISDPKTGKSYQKEVKDQEAKQFIGMKISETVKGDSFGMAGYDFQITGGSDYCGFPMRSGILGIRKKITAYGGIGFRTLGEKGMKIRKTVCGHKIHENISQINLKVIKEGSKKLNEVFGKAEEGKKEGKEEKKAEAKKEEAKPEKAEEKPKEEEKVAEAKGEKKETKEKKKEEKPKEEKKEKAEPKEEPKAEEKK